MRALSVLICLALLTFGASAKDECLKPMVDGQAAQGRLTVGRAKDAAERPERPYILRLASAVCLDGNDSMEQVESTRTIHVFPADDKLTPSFERLIGKSVVVRGSPFSRHTSHHHAPIVMKVSEIRQR